MTLYPTRLYTPRAAGSAHPSDVTPKPAHGHHCGNAQTIVASTAKTLLTGTVTAVLDTYDTPSGYLYSVMYYDDKKRCIQTKSSNAMGGYEEEYVNYNFTGQPTSKKHVHSATNKPTITEEYRYNYDHASRLNKTTHKLNNGKTVTLSENTYDEVGRLINTKLNNNENLTQTYEYNVRSWLTGIDNVHTSEFIYYNHKIDGIRGNGSSITYGDFIPCWNGNIAATTYLSSNGNIIGFNYTYDGLNRLTSAEDTKNPPLGSLRNVKNYSSTYSYDLNGNITALTRNDGLLSNSFEYGYSGNQLSSAVNNSQEEAEEEVETVFDGGKINSDNLQKLSGSMQQIVVNGKAKPTISTMFAYDLNGNFKSDNTKGTEYSYNVFNMPLQISVNNNEVIGTIKYKYDAQGNKLRADYSWLNATSIDKVKDGVGKVTKPKNSTQYIEYAGNKRYKDGALDMLHIDGGYIKNGNYFFYEKDHLGNNIAVIDTNGTLIQQTFYHPYGKPIDDLSFDLDVNNSQPYKYGGKEEETMLGLAMFDFHARQYYGNSDNRPPVFGQIDPFAGDYTNVSPYMYCAGNPINAIDPDGRRVVFIAGKSQFTYRNGSLWTASGNRVSRFSERLMGQAVQRGVNAYRSIENSGDMVLMGKLRTLVNSSNPHYVETTINGKDPRSVVVGYKEGKTVSEVEAMRANGESVGSQTLLNFSQEAKDEFMKNQGIPNSDFSTAAHEMQHSHDNEIGNMFDNTPLPADQNNNPAEKRAVGNENRARRIEGLPNRDSYEVVPASNGYGVKRAGTTNAYEHERPDWAQ